MTTQPLASFVNRLLQSDCVQVLRTMPSASVDFVLTDPPYLARYVSRDGRTVPNDDNAAWLDPAFAAVARVLKPDRFCVSFYGWHTVDHFMAAWRAAGLRPVGHFVWTKGYSSKKGYTQARHEQAYLLAKGRPAPPAVPPADVRSWRYSGNTLHPTQKPVTALEPLIDAYSAAGDLVLDPFAGSASTCVAARHLDRQYCGIELCPHYYALACQRMQACEAAA